MNHHLVLVRELHDVKGTAKAVLVALADRSNKKGECFPSIATISNDCGFSKTAVKAALRTLKNAGYITSSPRKDPAGDSTSNLYRLRLEGRAGDAPRRARDAPQVGRETPGGGAGAAPKAPYEAQGEATLFPDSEIPQDEKPSLESIAANIYEAYPRKAKKPKAINAIQKAMKKHQPYFLLERVTAYAKAIHWQERRFIPHPATWFNAEQFNDDPEEWKQPSTNCKTKPLKSDECQL
jgi:DNA-binding transcriptional MocR family regulator